MGEKSRRSSGTSRKKTGSSTAPKRKTTTEDVPPKAPEVSSPVVPEPKEQVVPEPVKPEPPPPPPAPPPPPVITPEQALENSHVSEREILSKFTTSIGEHRRGLFAFAPNYQPIFCIIDGPVTAVGSLLQVQCQHYVWEKDDGSWGAVDGPVKIKLPTIIGGSHGAIGNDHVLESHFFKQTKSNLIRMRGLFYALGLGTDHCLIEPLRNKIFAEVIEELVELFRNIRVSRRFIETSDMQYGISREVHAASQKINASTKELVKTLKYAISVDFEDALITHLKEEFLDPLPGSN